MDISEILRPLSHVERLPEAAIRAAAERRPEVVPAFLDVVEGFLAADPGIREVPSSLFFIFHMLGDYREKSAYRALARLLAIGEPEIDDVLGDGVTETSHRVMAAVFDGDPAPLYEIIEAEPADENVRSRMFETLAMLVRRGELERARVAKYLLDSFATLRPQREIFVWYGWQSAIAMLGLAEFSPLVEKAFKRRFISRSIMGFEHFQADLKRARQSRCTVGPGRSGIHPVRRYHRGTFHVAWILAGISRPTRTPGGEILGGARRRVRTGGTEPLQGCRTKRPLSLWKRQEVQEMLPEFSLRVTDPAIRRRG